MDAPMFLNQSGAIVTRFDGDGRYYYAESLPVIPHVETVAFPSVHSDAGALLSEHPENLLTLTYSSGAAVTFFCDSEAGGSNFSGDGSFENPWRNMRVAASNLSCYSCQLLAAYNYIQLKVKGSFDYLSNGEYWVPASGVQCGRIVLGGWDSVTRLPDNVSFQAGYFRDLHGGRLTAYVLGGSGRHFTVASNCVLVGSANPLLSAAINCSAQSGVFVNALYDCSAAQQIPDAAYVYYGSYTTSITSGDIQYGGRSFDRVYSTTIEYRAQNVPEEHVAAQIGSGYGVVVSGCVCGSGRQIINGFYGCSYLASSIVDLRASAAGGIYVTASAKVDAAVIIGGSLNITAVASGELTPSIDTAYVRAATYFESARIVSGATVTQFSDANVSVPAGFSSGLYEKTECIYSCCVASRNVYRNGVLSQTLTWSTGSCP